MRFITTTFTIDCARKLRKNTNSTEFYRGGPAPSSSDRDGRYRTTLAGAGEERDCSSIHECVLIDGYPAAAHHPITAPLLSSALTMEDVLMDAMSIMV